MGFTDDQQRAIDAIKKYRMVSITGPPGSGKSYLVQNMEVDGTVLITALANAALANYPAESVANMAQIRTRLASKRLPSPKGLLGQFLTDVALGRKTTLVIDEASLLPSKDLQDLHDGLCKLRRSPKLPFGGVSRIILVGDPDQLPPIGGNPIQTWSMFSRFHEVRLTSNKRFSDMAWASFLADVAALTRRCRNGEISCPEKESAALQLAKFIQAGHRPKHDGATLIGWRREDVSRATERELDASDVKLVLTPSPKLSLQASARNRETRVLAVGKPVRVTENPKVSETGTWLTPRGKRVYNGAVGVFLGVVDANGESIDVADGDVVAMGPDRRVCIDIDGEVVTLEPSRPFSGSGPPLSGFVVQLESAAGMTVTSAQGSTLPNGIHFVLERTGPCAGGTVPVAQLLVALQRCPNPDRVSISDTLVGVSWPVVRQKRASPSP